MQLPEKNFLKRECELFESDFESNRQIKPVRIMQFLQDAATEHGKIIGVGWDVLDAHGMLWVLSKMNVVFNKPVTRKTGNFSLYTWPISPDRFYAERCFVAEKNGEQLFSATSLWMMIGKNRKILPAETMNDFYHGEYSSAHSDALPTFARVRLDDSFVLGYEKVVRRSDLDLNGHVNNTNYITFAMDVLSPEEEICGAEIVFNKELKLGDVVKIYFKREGTNVFVVGMREETCFTVVLKLASAK